MKIEILTLAESIEPVVSLFEFTTPKLIKVRIIAECIEEWLLESGKVIAPDAIAPMVDCMTHSKCAEPNGTRFYSQARKQDMILVRDSESQWNGWIMYKHPDGQWVSLRKATQADENDLAKFIKT